MAVIIDKINKGSIASHLGIKHGERLISINNKEINDVLDYLFYATDEKLSLTVEGDKKGRVIFNISKGEHEDIGFVFNEFLMDRQRSCQNRCIFCFIDQLPVGMRESIYVKDDDERLSFLFGNYLTLTNLDESHISRLIEMNISPLNISIHTTDAELLSFMLNNKNAGESYTKVKKMAEAGIKLNCQIVLCKDINDGEKLRESLNDLVSFYPSVQSISVVPAGLTAFREGLFELKDFTKDDAINTLTIINDVHEECRKHFEVGLVYAADEWFLKAGMDIPELLYYDDMLQKENGVGMSALLEAEFCDALSKAKKLSSFVLAITGELAYPLIEKLMSKAAKRFPTLKYRVLSIKNEYFGGNVGVAGLLTATDILNQLQKEDVTEDKILIPRSMLRSEGDITLDDISLTYLEAYYKKKISAISDGYELLEALE